MNQLERIPAIVEIMFSFRLNVATGFKQLTGPQIRATLSKTSHTK